MSVSREVTRSDLHFKKMSLAKQKKVSYQGARLEAESSGRLPLWSTWKDDGGLAEGVSRGEEEMGTTSRDIKEKKDCHFMMEEWEGGEKLGQPHVLGIGKRRGQVKVFAEMKNVRGGAGEFVTDAPVSLPCLLGKGTCVPILELPPAASPAH